jgi:hypothetical protein
MHQVVSTIDHQRVGLLSQMEVAAEICPMNVRTPSIETWTSARESAEHLRDVQQ